MKLYITILSILFAVIASSCNNDKETFGKLTEAERLMDIMPDSSLAIIESIKDTKTLKKKTYAYYALLLTQALDKNYATPTSDSLINHSVEYYETTKDDKHKMLAFFYKSRIIKGKEKRDAINYLLKAEEIATKLQDHNILGLIYYDLGTLNEMQFIKLSTIDYFQKSATNFKLANNPLNEFYPHNSIAWILIQNEKFQEAFKELEKADRIANKLNNKELFIIVNNALAFNYACIDSISKAQSVMQRIVNNESNTVELLPEIYSTMAYIHSCKNDLKTALSIYKRTYKVFSERKDTAKMTSSLLTMSDVYKRMGDFENAYNCLNEHQSLMTNINNSISNNSIIEIEKHYRNEKIKAIKQELKVTNRNMWLLLTSSLLFASLCILLYFVVISEKNKKLMKIEIEQQKAEIHLQKIETKMLEAKQILLSKLDLLKSINSINNIWEGDKIKFDAKVQKLLDEYALTEESWDEVSRIINQMNDGLYDRLRKKHPNLSIDDIRLACMIIVGLEVK